MQHTKLDHEFLAPYEVRWCVPASEYDDDLEHTQSGPLILTRARASAIDLLNAPVGRSEIFSRLDLVYVRRGEILITAQGREIAVGLGQMILLDHEEAFSIHVASDTDCLCVLMPKYWMMRQNPRCESAAFKTFPSDQRFVATMRCFLDEWDAARSGPAHVIGVQFGGLLSLITASDPVSETRSSSTMAARIIDTIHEQCTNPLLNPDAVAADLRISRRHLYATLAKAGTTFGQELMAARLEASYLLLSNPEYNGLQIGEIAYLMGSQDRGHFNRRFRLRYHQKPSDIRNNALVSASAMAQSQ